MFFIRERKYPTTHRYSKNDEVQIESLNLKFPVEFITNKFVVNDFYDCFYRSDKLIILNDHFSFQSLHLL